MLVNGAQATDLDELQREAALAERARQDAAAAAAEATALRSVLAASTKQLAEAQRTAASFQVGMWLPRSGRYEHCWLLLRFRLLSVRQELLPSA